MATMFRDVAGRYTWASSGTSRTDLLLRDDGTFNAAYVEAIDPDHVGHLNPDTPSTTVNVTGRFSSIRKTDTGYALQCDAASLKVEDGGAPSALKSSGMAPCGAWRWYGGGATLQQVRDETGAWAAGGLNPNYRTVVLASDHGSGALFW